MDALLVTASFSPLLAVVAGQAAVLLALWLAGRAVAMHRPRAVRRPVRAPGLQPLPLVRDARLLPTSLQPGAPTPTAVRAYLAACGLDRPGDVTSLSLLPDGRFSAWVRGAGADAPAARRAA